jgi:hypothetical protein
MAVSIPDISVGTAVNGAAVISLSTTALSPNITTNSNRAGLIGVGFQANNQTGITGSIGGVSGSIVSGTDTGTSLGYRTLMMQVIAPPSGSQTATVSWTNACGCMIGAIVTSGVDQTTPFNNGTFAFHATNGIPSLQITSNNGDLTNDIQLNGASSHTDTTNQTSQWTQSVSTLTGGGGTGPGTGTTTHTWTIIGTAWLQSGANFNQALLPDAISSANITSSAGRFIGWTT